MTDEECIEAGTDILTNFDFIELGAREKVGMILRAAYPELFADPPKAWLAPWEASAEMADAVAGHLVFFEQYTEIRTAFAAMRTAHLAKEKGE